MVKKGNLNKDKKTGKFLPKRTTEDLVAGIGVLNEVINLKRELKDMRNILTKNLRGTLTAPRVGDDGLLEKDEEGKIKQYPYELSPQKLQALTKYIEMLMDKLAANAKAVDTDAPHQLDVVIKGPKRP